MNAQELGTIMEHNIDNKIQKTPPTNVNRVQYIISYLIP